MTLDIGKGQKTQQRNRVRALKIEYSIDGSEKTNAERERFLTMLRSRYGYANDRAVDELERLLKLFYRTNRSLDMHHAHPIYRHPRVE
jgi:hypothetical protein